MKIQTIGASMPLNYEFNMEGFMPKAIFKNPKYRCAVTDKASGTTANCSMAGVIERKN